MTKVCLPLVVSLKHKSCRSNTTVVFELRVLRYYVMML